MKRILTILLLVAFMTAVAQQEQYLQVKIRLNPGDIARIAKAGIATDAGFYSQKEGTYTAALSQTEFRKIQTLGINYTVEIDDLSEFYTRRNAGYDPETLKQQAMRATSDYPVPIDFELGSCGGFSTIEECYAHLDHMADLYPGLITIKQEISTATTILGEPIYYVKISDNPNEAEDEPQVLYTGMHHAREPIGMQHLLYYMYYILEHYETDAELRQLIDNTEMYFVPIFNVDGYQYNITTDPDGGGMWRKNRRNNGDGSFGIDINRNYGFFWGYDDEGSSPYTYDETYRGTAPFSEPETQIMKEFCETHDFKIALNYHSHSNLLLYPWGYTPEPSPDDNVFAEYSRRMTADNQYTYGAGSTTIYPTNGGSDDWMYGEQSTKNKILSYTPEVGNSNDGFWPQASRIIPLCQENMLQSLLAAKLAGSYAEIADNTPLIIPEKQYNAYFSLTRLGQTNGTYTVSIEPLDDLIISTGDPIVIDNLSVLQTRVDSIPFELSDKVVFGDTVRFVLAMDNGFFVTRDTVEKYYGTPVVVLYDDFPSIEKWTGNWGLYSMFPYSAPYSMADSPLGNYANNTNNSTTLVESISLDNASVAVLSFYARWRIEPGYDFVQVKISNNNGSTWTPLAGKYTHPGNDNQLPGQPLYDGIVNSWIREEINISEYAGQDIKIRFTLRSDGGTIADGYFFDNLEVSIIDVTTGVQYPAVPSGYFISEPRPNPASDITMISYNLPDGSGKARLSISEISGKEIMSLPLTNNKGVIDVNISGLAPGLYIYSLIRNGQNQGTGKLIKL
ncbi:MAG: immune inhibitor A [Bacteroidales bacterium]|nr:immune inhibitor A [Bacteroidales bacterium]